MPLTQEETETLCRVGPGTIMGDMMRQYWLPFLHTWELKPDDPPLRVRLLGEDLVVFRSTSGAYGLIGDRCAHRGGGMFFGRNENEGLRCVYHGWKYDTTGACVDLPNEPAESNFKSRVFIKSYTCAEHGGMIWAYMGPNQANPPGLPQLEWTMVPETHRALRYTYVLKNNWLQGLEGDIDSSHLAFLHNRNWDDTTSFGRRDLAPVYDVVDTPWGTMASAKRKAEPGLTYHRLYQMVFPFHSFFAGPGHIWVPIDDEHTLVHSVAWSVRAPIENREMSSREVGNPGMGPLKPEQKGKFFANWWPEADWDNDFLIDRELQRTSSFTGMPTVRIDDSSMTMSMGPIMDRGHERLGSGDVMIIRTRARLLNAALALREHGTPPPAVENPEVCRVRATNVVLPEGVDWVKATEDWCLARTNDLSEAQLAYNSGAPAGFRQE
jgi:phenylpropionate dioxygenase-like ring-hydroxylating dioxygenase large terminal subunit